MATTERITIKRTENLGNYSNIVVEESVLLNEGEDPEDVRKELLLTIEKQIAEQRLEAKGIEEQIYKLIRERVDLRDEIYGLKTKIRGMNDLIKMAENKLKEVREAGELETVEEVEKLIDKDEEEEEEEDF